MKATRELDLEMPVAEVEIGTIADARPAVGVGHRGRYKTRQQKRSRSDYGDAMRDDDGQGIGRPETNMTKEGAKLDSALALQLRATKALGAAMKLREIAQKRTDDAMAEMSAVSDGVEIARKTVGPPTGLSTNIDTCPRCRARQCRWWRKSGKRSVAQKRLAETAHTTPEAG